MKYIVLSNFIHNNINVGKNFIIDENNNVLNFNLNDIQYLKKNGIIKIFNGKTETTADIINEEPIIIETPVIEETETETKVKTKKTIKTKDE